MTDAPGPLSGIRVADFSTHAAGPFAGLMMAEMGAEVIKVESNARLDITRRPHPMYGKPAPSFEQVSSRPKNFCKFSEMPSVVSLVEPPAPQVMSTKTGCSAAMRSMRA